MSERQITGRQVFIVTASAFGIIIAVNLVMAFQAVSTFPGLEVKNSYVASQSFEARRDAQEALGWDVTLAHAGGELSVTISDASGNPVRAETVSLLIGRTTTATEDQEPVLVHQNGVYRAPLTLGSGYWTIRLKATAADDTTFEKRLSLYIPE